MKFTLSEGLLMKREKEAEEETKGGKGGRAGGDTQWFRISRLERFSVQLIAFHQCLDWNYVRAALQTNTSLAEMCEQFPPQATGLPIFQTS